MVNKIILVGRVGGDPEVKYVTEDNPVANFTLATSEKYKKSDGEKVEKTEWHRLVMWKNLAKIVEKYVKKGDLLYVEGKVTYRSYEDKDGVKKYITEVVVNNLVMLGGKKDHEQSEQSSVPDPIENYQSPVATAPKEEETDDMPF
jgi:single-strand DNA-binding protein